MEGKPKSLWHYILPLNSEGCQLTTKEIRVGGSYLGLDSLKKLGCSSGNCIWQTSGRKFKTSNNRKKDGKMGRDEKKEKQKGNQRGFKIWLTVQQQEIRVETLTGNFRSPVWSRSEENGELTTVVRGLDRIAVYIEPTTAEITPAKVKVTNG